jgi:transposase
MEVVIERVAGLDVHKETVMAAVRTPGGRDRSEEIREFSTYTGDLVALRDWLAERQVSQVTMEATGVYWKPVWNVLEDAESFELVLVNARHVKNLPGRKTDVSDAAWLARLAECGLLRGSFVPPREIAELRDLTRYRQKLVEERVREVQRLQKVLEDAGVKLESVVSDITGKAARQMIEALIAGERDPAVLADMALTRMRPKIPELRRALVGRWNAHHSFLATVHLERMDQLAQTIARLDTEVDRVMAPFAEPRARLETIPGIGKRVAEVIVAECGVDMTRFPTAGHLASWAGLCPGHHESAGKQTTGRARQPRPARGTVRSGVVGRAHEGHLPLGPVPTLPASLRDQVRGKGDLRRGPHPRGHVWHVLASPDATYEDLGPDWFTSHSDTQAHVRRLVNQLERLGMKVNWEPTAA